MRYIADLHIHSHYSIATSSRLVPEHLEYWARLKGINIIGTGDCIHPGWFDELKTKLEPCGNGLYRLRDKFRLDESKRLRHPHIPEEVFFILTGELSSIYKRDGRVRKVHNICVFPDFDSCKKVLSRLDAVANIRSDGRPILGIDSRTILDMVLESGEGSFLVPAHIWTPWFSVLGSKSGFDSIDECYGDLTRHIFAVETGLSSDPPMNWTCSFLDNFRLVSNSDAHSPEKIGREANLFDAELSYSGMYNALKNDKGFLGTIEFFPEEGKYHLDGHKKCGIVWDPVETAKHSGVCPVCGKEVTKGVMYRVAELGDRSLPREDLPAKEFHSITQLPDLLSEVMGQKNSSSKSVMNEYMRLVKSTGSEFHIYLDSEIDEIRAAGGDVLAEGIRRLRSGQVHLEGGYDGEFGTVKVFSPGEMKAAADASLLFVNEPGPAGEKRSGPQFDINEFRKLSSARTAAERPAARPVLHELTEEQNLGATWTESPCLVIAGPGSGKTRMLSERINYLVKNGLALPREIAALTFSNRAAGEVRERVGGELIDSGLTVATFHSLGLSIISENIDRLYIDENFKILSDDMRLQVVREILPDRKKAGNALKMISSAKQGVQCDADPLLMGRYIEKLTMYNSIDIDDLIDIPCTMLASDIELREKYNRRMPWLLVDEFQDINAAQYSFIRLLTPPDGHGLFVIGDPDQAIYGFRGSDVKYIDALKSDYPATKTVHLTRSFRCGNRLLRAAGQVLGKGEYLVGPGEGLRLKISECESDRAEADQIASSIENMLGGVRSFSMDSGMSDGTGSGLGLSDFAILCRSSFMFAPLVEALSNHGIPYQKVDTEAFYFSEPYVSLLGIIRMAFEGQGAGAEGEHPELSTMIDMKESLASMLNFIAGSENPEYDRHLVERNLSRVFDLAEFFRSSALRKGADDYVHGLEAVSLITIHSSKGLEFNTVFIPGCEEGVIPFSLFGQENAAEEERIFYVALTRGVGSVYLSHAKKRLYRGRILEHKRSRFLDRIEKELLESEKRGPKQRKKDDNQLKLF